MSELESIYELINKNDPTESQSCSRPIKTAKTYPANRRFLTRAKKAKRKRKLEFLKLDQFNH